MNTFNTVVTVILSLVLAFFFCALSLHTGDAMTMYIACSFIMFAMVVPVFKKADLDIVTHVGVSTLFALVMGVVGLVLVDGEMNKHHNYTPVIEMSQSINEGVCVNTSTTTYCKVDAGFVSYDNAIDVNTMSLKQYRTIVVNGSMSTPIELALALKEACTHTSMSVCDVTITL